MFEISFVRVIVALRGIRKLKSSDSCKTFTFQYLK